jgi:hypothetical protein
VFDGFTIYKLSLQFDVDDLKDPLLFAIHQNCNNTSKNMKTGSLFNIMETSLKKNIHYESECK